VKKSRVVDQDPDWIRIQWLCGSEFGIRIHGLEKWRKKCTFLFHQRKTFPQR
jgi:hypothetical protein